MKRMTLEEWEAKYITGEVEPFDQKNTMFIRPLWDPEINRRLENWSFVGEVKDMPGYSMEDLALRWAARRGTQIMQIFNTYRPNPSGLATAIRETIEEHDPRLSSIEPYKPPEGRKVDVSDPERITSVVKKAARWFGADAVGICRLDRRWAYSHTFAPKGGRQLAVFDGAKVGKGKSKPQEISEEYQYAVVLVFAEDYHMMKYYPTNIAHAVTSMGYSRMGVTNNYLAAFIRNLGYQTIDGTTNAVANTIPMAMQAGLGDIGRHGLLITPKWGPRVRLSKVITDLPLVPDAPIDFGVTELCLKCEICADKCPSQSIMKGDRTPEPNNVSNLRNTLKWPLNAETCRMYWGRSNKPCTTCIACCPYNKPDTRFHRLVRWFTDHVRWGDPLYVKMDLWFGYGKPKNPDNFWEDWDPTRH